MSERPQNERPEAYRIGRARFMGLELEAAPGALVPRAETELLGATAVRLLRTAAAAAAATSPAASLPRCRAFAPGRATSPMSAARSLGAT